MQSILLKYKFLQSKFVTKLDQLNKFLVIFIVFAILLLAYYALLRPVNPLQYQLVVEYSHQASHPRTQFMAKQFLMHTPIRRVEYLKLLHAYHFESSRIKQYPAMKQEDE